MLKINTTICLVLVALGLSSARNSEYEFLIFDSTEKTSQRLPAVFGDTVSDLTDVGIEP